MRVAVAGAGVCARRRAAGIRKEGRKDLLVMRICDRRDGGGRFHAEPLLRRAGRGLRASTSDRAKRRSARSS